MPTPCPRCSAPLTGAATCPECQLSLTGPLAVRLWQVDQQIAIIDGKTAELGATRQQLWTEHVRLVVAISDGTTIQPSPYPAVSAFPPPVAPPIGAVWGGAASPRQRPHATQVAAPVAPAQEWTPRRVQNLLLCLGAGLVVLATAIVTLVSWHHLGAGVRAAILIAVTGGAAYASRELQRRGLEATAEAVAAICLGFALLDAYACQALLLSHVSGRGYWAVASVALALWGAAVGWLARVRVGWIAAAALALAPLLIAATGDVTSVQRATLLALDALVAGVGRYALTSKETVRLNVADVRQSWLVLGGAIWVAAFATGVVVVHETLSTARANVPGSHGVAALALAFLVLAVAAALTACVEPTEPLRSATTGTATLAGVAGLSAPFLTLVPGVWGPAVVAAAALFALVAGSLLPSGYRHGSAFAATAVTAVAAAAELPSLVSTLSGQVGWVHQPWAAAIGTTGVSSTQIRPGAATLITMALVAAFAAVAGDALSHRVTGFVTAATIAVLAAAVTVPQLSGPYAIGLSVALVLTVAAMAAACALGVRSPVATRSATALAVALAALTLCWSLALPSATAVAGFTLAATLLATATVESQYRPQWLASAAIAMGFGVTATAHLAGASPALLALILVGTAALIATAATAIATMHDAFPAPPVALDSACAAMALVALRLSVGQPVTAGWVLAIAGLTVLAAATVQGRQAWWPAGALLIAMASWVWLAVAGVGAPEPYTDPIALVAIVTGYQARRARPETTSLTAYGLGLALLLLPSLAVAITGTGVERPLMLATLSALVVIIGARQRLRAPLMFGSATLVLTSLWLMSPYLQVIPRWLELGTAGAVLLALGATYEQRRRELGMLRSRYEALV